MEANFQLPLVVETFILHFKMEAYKTSHRFENKTKKKGKTKQQQQQKIPKKTRKKPSNYQTQ